METGSDTWKKPTWSLGSRRLVGAGSSLTNHGGIPRRLGQRVEVARGRAPTGGQRLSVSICHLVLAVIYYHKHKRLILIHYIDGSETVKGAM